MTASALVRGGGPKARWNRDNIIEKIREWERLYGDPPRAADWNPSAAKWSNAEWRIERYRAGDWPSLNAVKKLFNGSLNEAIIAAGFEPAKPGPPSRKNVNPTIPDREVMSPAARAALDAARAEARDLAEKVEIRDRQLARVRAGADRLRDELLGARRERPAKTVTKTKTKTKVVRERVLDERAVAREKAKVEKAEALAAEARASATEAKTTATRLAARLERAEATISTLRDERREAREALRRRENRVTALERMLEDARNREPEVKVERVEIEVESVEGRQVAAALARADRAERDRAEAEMRAAESERAMRETVALVKGEPRRLTRAEVKELRLRGPSGPGVLTDAFRELAKARALGKAPLMAALTKVASAAITWRESL